MVGHRIVSTQDIPIQVVFLKPCPSHAYVMDLTNIENVYLLKLIFHCTGIDVDIDVEHEGNRAKVTPPPSTSSGPPSGRSDSSSGGPSKGADGSPSSVGSTNGGTKVTK